MTDTPDPHNAQRKTPDTQSTDRKTPDTQRKAPNSAHHIQRKMSAPCKNSFDKPRYYTSGKRTGELKIDTSTR